MPKGRLSLERQAIFLASLERTGNVRTAAGAAGMNRAGAYRLRDRADGQRFRYAWTLALARRRERLLQERLAKATHALARLDAAGKGDTRREAAQHRQPSQSCRFLAGDPDAPLAARWPNA